MKRREFMTGAIAVAAASAMPASSVAVVEPVALDPFTYFLAKHAMSIRDLDARVEFCSMVRLPWRDEAYADFDGRYREMTPDEWRALRKARKST